VAEGVGRCQGGVGDVEAVTTSVLARTGVDESRWAVIVYWRTVAADVDRVVVYRARESQ
jgi:hypothetical protein